MCEWPSTSPGVSVVPGRSMTLRAGGGDARLGPDRVDAFAFHAHRPPLVHRLAVEHARRPQHRDRCVSLIAPAALAFA